MKDNRQNYHVKFVFYISLQSCRQKSKTIKFTELTKSTPSTIAYTQQNEVPQQNVP